MASTSEDGRNIVKLELSHINTIHVTSGVEKIASLCIVVKDTESVEGLQNNPHPISKMVITDVIPLKDDPTKAEILFRHLSSQEIVEESRRFLILPGSLENIFGAYLQGEAEDLYDDEEYEDDEQELNTTVLEHDTSEELTDDETFSQVLKEAKKDLVVTSDESSEIFENILEKMESSAQISNETNLYSVIISLAEAHLGQMLCVSTNAPAFVLTSEAGFDAIASSEDKNVWEDFLAILEFPYPDTSAYFDSTATLIQSVTGSFPINVRIEDINFLRAQLMDRIVGISNGRVESLIEAFSFINPANKAFQHKNKNIKPTAEDSLQLVTMDVIEKLYDVTMPGIISGLVKTTPFTPQSIQEMETLDNLLSSSGLNESFGDILAEEYEKTPLKLSSSPTNEEIIAYYSAPATKSSFPKSLKHLVDRIQMPLFYAHNWVGGNVEIEETKNNIGEINVSKIIAVAIRYARLKEIVQHVEDEFVPIVLILRALNFPSEPSTWAYLESIKIMSRNVNKTNTSDLFTELMLPGLPTGEEEEEIIPEEILRTPGATILHKVAHLILDDAWDKGILISKASTTHLNDFINEVYDLAEEVAELGDSDKEPCPIMKAVFRYFTNNQNAQETVKEIGQLVVAMGELNALKNTNYSQDSKEWNEYIESFYGALFKN